MFANKGQTRDTDTQNQQEAKANDGSKKERQNSSVQVISDLKVYWNIIWILIAVIPIWYTCVLNFDMVLLQNQIKTKPIFVKLKNHLLNLLNIIY